MQAHEHVAFLAGSANRVRLLRELREQSGRGAGLARRCSLPRSTVHRGLGGLAARGWVRKEGRNYSLTTAGAVVLSAYEDLAETIAVTADREEFLDDLGEVGRTLPIEAIAGATAIESTPASPHAAMEHYCEVYRSNAPDRVRGTIPVASHSLNEAARPSVERAIRIEMVIDEDVLDTAREVHPDAYRYGLDSDNFVLYVREEPIRFGLAILDDERALVGAYDEHGAFRACLDGTNDALVEWAIETYENVRRTATRVEPAIESV